MAREFDEYRGTALWKAVEATLTELVATSEVRIDTAPDYVIGYLCRELAAKRLVVSEAVQRTS